VIALAALPAGCGMSGPVGGGGLAGAVDVVAVPVVVVPGGVVPVVDAAVVVVVPVVVVPVVVVPVVVVLVVGGGAATTLIVAVMNGCRSQRKVYVPAVLNLHVPLHPGLVG
jgi:hypothetical protein